MKFLNTFRSLVETQPDAKAFIHRDETMTYRVLDALSDDLGEQIKHSKTFNRLWTYV